MAVYHPNRLVVSSLGFILRTEPAESQGELPSSPVEGGAGRVLDLVSKSFSRLCTAGQTTATFGWPRRGFSTPRPAPERDQAGRNFIYRGTDRRSGDHEPQRNFALTAAVMVDAESRGSTAGVQKLAVYDRRTVYRARPRHPCSARTLSARVAQLRIHHASDKTPARRRRRAVRSPSPTPARRS